MRLLLISDVHANIEALQALNERYDYLICLGDLVDHGPTPREALQFLREHASLVVRGNHDHAVGYRVDCESSPLYHEFSVATRASMWQVLNEDDVVYLRNFPVNRTLELGGARF